MSTRSLLPKIFSSLTRSSSSAPTTWTLLRTLKSENPNDIQGDLHGSATFTYLNTTPTPDVTDKSNTPTKETDLLYSESGSLPTTFGPGLRWTKKYIWRLADDKISVWFVKPESNAKGVEEADYLFHEFDFEFAADPRAFLESAMDEQEFVNPPVPPVVELPGAQKTRVIAARGNHLCIEDMYRTAYAFRVAEGSGEVVSWASRHVVRGPKKGQDIVNMYSRA
ncbi:hypothetical protein BDV18DRAFT_163779 [Aspergillus unguis]